MFLLLRKVTRRKHHGHHFSSSSILQVTDKKVSIQLNNGTSSSFHYSWLHHNCLCSKCRQPSSGQRLMKDTSFQVEKVELDNDNNLVVRFNKDHIANFPLEFLKNHRYDHEQLNKESIKLSSLHKTTTLPRLSFHSVENNPLSWMTHVLESGVCVIESTPRKEETLLEFIKPSGCEASHRLYGTTFMVEATLNPINVAYSSEALEPHQDLAYYESPPGIQFLHCLEFDSTISGGESTFIDGHAAAEILKQRKPKSFEILTKIPATFQKDHVHREDPAKMFYERPHIHVNHLNEITAIFWAPPFEGPLRVDENFVDSYYEAYHDFNTILKSNELWEKYGIQFRLKPGDLVIFNNRRYLHGRNAFQVPVGSIANRKLHGCYLEMDRFLNRIRVLNWKLSGDDSYQLPTRPGISSYR